MYSTSLSTAIVQSMPSRTKHVIKIYDSSDRRRCNFTFGSKSAGGRKTNHWELPKLWEGRLYPSEWKYDNQTFSSNLLLSHQRIGWRSVPLFRGIDKNCVPIRTRHQQSLPPWVSSSTLNLLKSFETKEDCCLRNKPHTGGKMWNLWGQLWVVAQNVFVLVTNKTSWNKETLLIFKQLKSRNRKCKLPQVLIKDRVSYRNKVQKFNMLNHNFLSVFTTKTIYYQKHWTKKTTFTDFQ